MTPEQFWHGDPWLCKVYRDAYQLKLQEQNNSAWLQGLYVYNAVATVASQMTSKKKVKYMEKPLDIFGVEKEVPKEEQERKNHEAIFEMLSQMMAADERKKQCR